MTGAPDIDVRSLRSKADDNLGAWDLRTKDGTYREVTVEIESVSRFRPLKPKTRRLPDGTVKEEKDKLLISFKGKRKAWVCGPVSEKVIAKLAGGTYLLRKWIGLKITLYFDPDVMFGRERVGGIRVRPMRADGPLTDDPLDNPVDAERLAQLEECNDATA